MDCRHHLPLSLSLLISIWVLACGGDEIAGEQEPQSTPDAATISDELPSPASADVFQDSGPVSRTSTLDFDVKSRGPFGVGYRTLEHSYVPAGADKERKITLYLWYPSTSTEGEHPIHIGLFPDEHAIIDGVAAEPVGPTYPVHVYSHGHQGFAATSANLMGYFASHGWVAIAPDHVGDLLIDSSQSETIDHFLLRPQDITQALNALEELPTSDPLSRADTSAVVLSGHSRGTYSVWSAVGAAYDEAAILESRPDITDEQLALFLAGFGDSRVSCGIPMAGTYRKAWFGVEGYLAVSVPILGLTGENDGPASSQAQWNLLDGIDFSWVELSGACHQSFALGACDTLAPEQGFAIVNTYSLAFARAHVLGDSSSEVSGILSGSIPVAAEAEFQKKR